MRHLKNTTELLGIKDPHIKIILASQHQSHIEVQATLDYPAPSCPHCQGKMIKYDWQRPSKIPLLEQAGMPTLLKLKKRRFQCKACKRVVVSETDVVEKNCQISNLVRQKVADLLTDKVALTDIARRLHISTSTVYRKLNQFRFKESYDKLPEILSWDEFSFQKGQLAFIAQDFKTREIIAILENRRQTTIRNYFLKYSVKARKRVKVITLDMSGAYIPLARRLFPNATIVLDRFHIIQHLNRAMNRTRIQMMKQFDRNSLPYRAIKYFWKRLLQDSRTLSDTLFYNRTFRAHLSPREIVQKIKDFSPELADCYDLYQLLLYHFQEKNSQHFFELIHDCKETVNTLFFTVFKTFEKYRPYITNALELDYSNAKLEATNKLIKDIKRQGFGYRNFPNFKKRIYLILNSKKERTNWVLSRT